MASVPDVIAKHDINTESPEHELHTPKERLLFVIKHAEGLEPTVRRAIESKRSIPRSWWNWCYSYELSDFSSRNDAPLYSTIQTAES